MTRRTTATPRSPGLPELRAAIAAKTKRDTGYEVDAAQVLVTNGGKQAVYNAFATLLDPGDEVILVAPYWTTYPEAIKLAGGVPVEVVADETTGYLASVEQLEAARTERTKVLLFVSPSNPTGAVYPGEQVEAIGAWAAEHGLWVVTDEIYEHLLYDGAEMVSIAHSAGEKVVVLNGVAKTYAMTGWRVGWLIGPTDIVKAAANLQSHSTSNVSNVAQVAALAAVSGDLSAVAEMRAVYDRRRKTIVSMLSDIPGIVCPSPQGAFYVYPSVKGLLGRPIARPHRGRLGRARRDHPRGGRGRGRAGRGIRYTGLLPDVVRAGRRRPGRGRQPHRQAGRGVPDRYRSPAAQAFPVASSASITERMIGAAKPSTRFPTRGTCALNSASTRTVAASAPAGRTRMVPFIDAGAPWKSTDSCALRLPSVAAGPHVTVSVEVTPDGTNLRSSDGNPIVGSLRLVRTTAMSPSRSTVTV